MSNEVQILNSLLKDLANPESGKSAVTIALRNLCDNSGARAACLFSVPHEEDLLVPIATAGFSANEYRKLSKASGTTSLNEFFGRGGSEDSEKSPISIAEILGDSFSDCQELAEIIAPAGRPSGLLVLVFDKGRKGDSAKSILATIAGIFSQHLKVEKVLVDQQEQLLKENTQLRQELKEKHDFSQLIGNSSEMKSVLDQVSQVAKSNATVLIRGESGTGKELIANSIHYNSLRSKQPFVKVNCAALPETLIESELFGYEKGAFTGADRRKVGRFEAAEGGTIFLDEIGELPIQTQIKLLRVLQEKEFQRLGSNETIKANVRIIAATNVNIEEAIRRGTFREDLFYRLNIFTIFLPPLRDRKADILLLAEHFLEKYEAEYGKRIRRISTPAIDMLTQYHFPGNVRELENVIERSVLVCDSNVIHAHHLPPSLQTAEETGTEPKGSLDSAVAALEADLIQDALKTARGNVAKAARMLDSTERKIGYKIKKYGLVTDKYKS